jgi:hypothetical protein
VGGLFGGTASAKLDESITFSGTAITLHHTGANLVNSSTGAISSGGLVEISKVNNTVHAPGVIPMALNISYGALSVRSQPGSTSFGGQRRLAGMRPMTLELASDTTQLTVSTPALRVSGDAQPLSILADQGLVLQLVTLVLGQGGDVEEVVTPARDPGGTLFLPAEDVHASLGSGSPCAILLQDSASRCQVYAGL